MRFLVRRMGLYLITLWAAVTVNFFLPRMMGGDPVLDMLGRMGGRVTPEQVNALRVQFGENTTKSLFAQYTTYLNHLVHGNLGLSVINFPDPVSHVIRSALPWTLFLVGTGSVVAFVLGTMIGIGIGWRRSPVADAIVPFSTFLSAIPYFWLGLVLLAAFAVAFHWAPVSGGYAQGLRIGFGWSFISSALGHSVLPAITIVVSSIAGWMLGMRNMMVTTLSEDYVMVAQAKGLPNRRVIFTYAARNALLPNVAGFALQLGFVVAGSLLTEIVFSYPGIGYILLTAVTNDDFPTMQGIFLVITLCVLIANFFADLVYVVLDPRTRQEA